MRRTQSLLVCLALTVLVAVQPIHAGAGMDALVSAPDSVNVSPTLLKFMVHVIGETSGIKRVTLTNTGTDPLTINQMQFTGNNPGDFAQTNNCGSSLAAGKSCKILVTFTPQAKDGREATLEISDSDPSSPQKVFVSGTGTAVLLSTKLLAFDAQAVGTTSMPQNVTLTNVGTRPISFFPTTIVGLNRHDFSQTNTCEPSIAVGASCTFTVMFKPTGTGARKAKMVISDDGSVPPGTPQVVTLTGTGT